MLLVMNATMIHIHLAAAYQADAHRKARRK
jgi:hypothetical protein